MRGKGGFSTGFFVDLWIIPAGAGKSKVELDGLLGAGDHPRGCGEKDLIRSEAYQALGSSPRVRGKGDIMVPSVRDARIIPAGAGKSRLLPPPPRRAWDHPRGCGEKAIIKIARATA